MYPELQLVPPWIPFSDEINEFNPDLILLLNPASLGMAGILWARRSRVPAVASYNTDIPGYADRWGMGYLREPLWTYFRWIHNQAELNFAPSNFTLEEIRAQGFQRVKVWSRGVDTDLYQPSKRTQIWRDRLTKGNPDAPLLLYVGRLAPEKRVAMLRPVLDAIPEARLAITGGGPERENLEKVFAGTPTVFTGYLKGNQLARAYASADIFTFPSANETFGNVVLEAMASGLPVVVPRSGGVLDFVRDGENGLFFETECVDSLIRSVQTLIDYPNYRLKLGGYARSSTDQRSWKTILDDLLGELEMIVSQRSNQCLQLAYN
jgi:glycosyltransferase involved in cell wall biosynthesis